MRSALVVGCLLALGPPVVPAVAAADEPDCSGRREVLEGDSLWSIARECGISVSALRRANDLDDDAGIRPGQRLRIPEPRNPPAADGGSRDGGGDAPRRTGGGIRVELRAGQTLSDLAREHGISVRAIQRANDIEDPDLVEAGRTLRIPDDDVGGTGSGTRAASTPIAIHRIKTGEEETVRLYDARGRLRSSAHRTVNRLLRDVSSGRTLRIAPELLQLLQRVADRWPGRRFRVQSGVRPLVDRPGREPGNHMRGRAVDFSVEGVSNRDLRDFCRTLPNAGVGYYPNSTFVHLDTRDRPTFWVDLSGPGEPADYVDDPEGWVRENESVARERTPADEEPSAAADTDEPQAVPCGDDATSPASTGPTEEPPGAPPPVFSPSAPDGPASPGGLDDAAPSD
ncbi:MAG: LysM peptidoglycan-binding domain-containing protein [Deltaproteobacteria bacterium]|nr:LysM peptidoglycan-binding domain-containing protein [Deltaproteobacteria bacterium]